MEGLSVKNTFIHFQFVDSVVAHNARRSRSEPPLPSARLECHKNEANTCNRTTCSSSGGGGSSGSSKSTSSSSSSSNEEFAWSGADDNSKKPNQKHQRPCKSKRDAFRKFVDTLKKQLSENPQAFSLEDVEIPKRFCRTGSRSKVAAILAGFLEEVGGFGAHSAM